MKELVSNKAFFICQCLTIPWSAGKQCKNSWNGVFLFFCHQPCEELRQAAHHAAHCVPAAERKLPLASFQPALDVTGRLSCLPWKLHLLDLLSLSGTWLLITADVLQFVIACSFAELHVWFNEKASPVIQNLFPLLKKQTKKSVKWDFNSPKFISTQA